MMSVNRLTVRCLASTSVAEVRQETGGNGQDLDVSGHGDFAKDKEVEEDTNGSGDDDDLTRQSQDEDDCVQEDDNASAPASSDSSTSTDSDSGSDDRCVSSRIFNPSRPVVSTSCIQEAQLSPDGTCIFTSGYDRAFSVYPIGTDILESTATRPLKPYAQFKSADPIWAFAANPLFNLQDPSSTHVLVSRRDRYITLHNALWDVSSTNVASELPSSPINIHTPLAAYKLINHLNEAVTAPLSLAYSPSGTHFFAGGQNSIATFDLTNTDDPIHTIPTIPSRRNKLKGGGRGFKGYISALSISPPTSTSSEGLLAAGSRTRYIGIYDSLSGGEITHFSLPGTVDGKKLRNANLAHVMGDGVSSLKWSPCVRYLYVAERQSDVLLIYDVRNFSLALGYCAGRRALSKQKLGFDVWNAGASPYDVECVAHEVWAGGTDGKVRVWKDPYTKEGAVEADEVVDIEDGETMPVVSTLVHASGSLAVTARGTLDTSDSLHGGGIQRGGGTRPRFTERGCLDILGLSSY
ncbi:hypothetical protein EKO04_005980 [Ascochyta lentis]|uniref:WD40 repeat-like protein n=1 Tax=Ascochyta lentis TaxID=205686 RepID=A0A8H7J3J5_9PLEO|nr:hypothetical protein EKO04_005980 [Ascochyta lentis]